MQLSETDLAYAAGLIDGEGCIRINIGTTTLGQRKDGLVLSVAMTNPLPIHFLHKLFDGNIDYREISNKQPTWTWYVSTRLAVEILEKLYPYMLVKKEQAIIAILFGETMSPSYRARGVPSNVLNIRKYLAEQCSTMKKESYFSAASNG